MPLYIHEKNPISHIYPTQSAKNASSAKQIHIFRTIALVAEVMIPNETY